MKPYHVHATTTAVEVWTGYRVQFGGMERHQWQKTLKAEVKAAFCGIAYSNAPFTGFYDTIDRAVSDVENSLFTNWLGHLPAGITLLRFERGPSAPPEPPVDIDRVGGHLHYYRYTIGGRWTTWDADAVLARWDRVPRRLALDGSAGPGWMALRHGRADGKVELTGASLYPDENFGVRLTVHATSQGPKNAITVSENIVDGTLAAFHSDVLSEALFPNLKGRFPRVTEDELRRALDNPIGPLFPTPAIRPFGKSVQFSPADERCIVGEVEIRRDATGSCSELSGELFTVRRR